MDRLAVFVDAGYFFAAGSQAAYSAVLPRRHIRIRSAPNLLNDLAARATQLARDLPLLRIYWYDAMPGPRLSLEQSTLAMLPGIKLRLGALNSEGEQKGVDSLIVTDLIELARNQAIADAVVVSGDEDLRIAVQVAQSFGVRVHILAAGDPARNVSPTLQMEADSVHVLDGSWFVRHLESTAPARQSNNQAATAVPEAAVMSLADAAAAVSAELLEQVADDQLALLAEHFKSSTSVPPEFDRKLIAKVATARGGLRLTGDEMRQVRGVFVREVRARSKT